MRLSSFMYIYMCLLHILGHMYIYVLLYLYYAWLFLEEALAYVSKYYKLNAFPSDQDHEARAGLASAEAQSLTAEESGA